MRPLSSARLAVGLLLGLAWMWTAPDCLVRKAESRQKARSNLYDALAFALVDPEIDTVFFLSEGAPNEGRWVERERFMRHLVRLNVYQRVQVHALQVTNDRAGAAFLRRLAEDTGGRFYGVEELEAARR